MPGEPFDLRVDDRDRDREKWPCNNNIKNLVKRIDLPVTKLL